MPTKKLQHGRRMYGVEDEAGNVLIEPSATTKAATRVAAARLAERRGESVYMFEVGRDNDGTSIVVDREELRPRALSGLTSSHIRKLQKRQRRLQSSLIASPPKSSKSSVQIKREVDEVLRASARHRPQR